MVAKCPCYLSHTTWRNQSETRVEGYSQGKDHWPSSKQISLIRRFCDEGVRRSWQRSLRSCSTIQRALTPQGQQALHWKGTENHWNRIRFESRSRDHERKSLHSSPPSMRSRKSTDSFLLKKKALSFIYFVSFFIKGKIDTYCFNIKNEYYLFKKQGFS